MKTATKAIVLTAKGEVSKQFRNALMCARFDETTNKIYPCRWMKSGRKFACSDKSALIINVLKAQGYRYEEGNDAPKGGLEGNYIKVSKAALSFLKQFRKWN